LIAVISQKSLRIQGHIKALHDDQLTFILGEALQRNINIMLPVLRCQAVIDDAISLGNSSCSFDLNFRVLLRYIY